ncbi:MAG: hypothetical protein M1829_001716 [Trizodia sp. TS-e1964]|nr:MAG: hypothetical protein M1829_001716 [Trizodia sp. TS-e1964]
MPLEPLGDSIQAITPNGKDQAPANGIYGAYPIHRRGDLYTPMLDGRVGQGEPPTYIHANRLPVGENGDEFAILYRIRIPFSTKRIRQDAFANAFFLLVYTLEGDYWTSTQKSLFQARVNPPTVDVRKDGTEGVEWYLFTLDQSLRIHDYYALGSIPIDQIESCKKALRQVAFPNNDVEGLALENRLWNQEVWMKNARKATQGFIQRIRSN